MNLPAVAFSTNYDQTLAEFTLEDLVGVANRSSEITMALVNSAVGFQQGITETTSGANPKQSFLTAIASGGVIANNGVVTNIGQLLYSINKKPEASPLGAERTPVIFADPKKTIDPDVRKLPAGLFKLLQAWEGIVVSVREDNFVARIRDKTNKSNPDEEVTLPKEEIVPSDQDQIVEGAVFYWSIGYKDAPGEPRRRTSQIRFRRLPAWSNNEQAIANKYEEALRKAFIGPR